jgi:hypothetical protein
LVTGGVHGYETSGVHGALQFIDQHAVGYEGRINLIVAPGVINYPLKKLGLCAGITDTPYKTTTEVYPDSPRATPEQCNRAQVAAVCAAIDFALRHRTP